MTRIVGFAAAVVRGWTRVYTAMLPASLREERRAELTADAYDHLADLRDRDTPPARAAIELLRRLVTGMADDVSWALSAHLEETMNRTLALAVAGWMCAVLVALLGVWTAVAGLADGWRELPQHWWSVLAATGVAVAALGLGSTIIGATRRWHR